MVSSYGSETIHFPFLLFDLPHIIPQFSPLDQTSHKDHSINSFTRLTTSGR